MASRNNLGVEKKISWERATSSSLFQGYTPSQQQQQQQQQPKEGLACQKFFKEKFHEFPLK